MEKYVPISEEEAKRIFGSTNKSLESWAEKYYPGATSILITWNCEYNDQGYDCNGCSYIALNGDEEVPSVKGKAVEARDAFSNHSIEPRNATRSRYNEDYEHEIKPELYMLKAQETLYRKVSE